MSVHTQVHACTLYAYTHKVRTKPDLKLEAYDLRQPQSGADSPSTRNKSIACPAYDKFNWINWIRLNNRTAWKRTGPGREQALGTVTKYSPAAPG